MRKEKWLVNKDRIPPKEKELQADNTYSQKLGAASVRAFETEDLDALNVISNTAFRYALDGRSGGEVDPGYAEVYYENEQRIKSILEK